LSATVGEAILLELGDFQMMRKMLSGINARAEPRSRRSGRRALRRF